MFVDAKLIREEDINDSSTGLIITLIDAEPRKLEPGDSFNDVNGSTWIMVRQYQRGENSAIDSHLEANDTLLVVKHPEEISPGVRSDYAHLDPPPKGIIREEEEDLPEAEGVDMET